MAQKTDALLIARSKKDISILPRMANRHGLVAGATGTGKTVTLRVMAEQFSRIGVPVFLADVKGDLSGMAKAGGDRPEPANRAKQMGLAGFTFEGCPTVFWDVFGQQGHPVRTTISDMGPLLLSRILNLNEVQGGVLTLIFKIADDNGLLLLDLKDLKAMAQFAGDNAATFRTEYGNISAASIGAIQRGLLALEEQGGAAFFGEPTMDLSDLMQTGPDGRGVINILAADRLMQSPKLYATFLLWMLAELFETLPEVGDPDKPGLVFFFDEAHLLFDDAPKALEDKIVQVVRLIRSKGVGVYFVTQNPLDVPETVLGQLGNRVQHALRAFTPRDQKAVRTAADTFRSNPGLDTAKVITELAVGEALVSVLDAQGSPTVVERALICPPASRLTPLSSEERSGIIKQSVLFGHYEKVVDRESAYEKLKARTNREKDGEAPAPARKGRTAEPVSETEKVLGAMAKSAAHAIGSQIGRQIIRGVLGSLFGGGGKKR
jgi:DNA helicase HerA-like ATPase